MAEYFDPTKEGRRVVRPFGERNESQVTEDQQREQENEARANDGKAEENKRS
jgi:hypothetical protein